MLLSDRAVAIDTEFDKRKVPFLASSCDWELKSRLYRCNQDQDKAKLKRICEDRSITKVMFPVCVDMHALRNMGIICQGDFEDPLTAGVLLDENFANRKGLKAMAQRYLGEDIKEARKLTKYKTKYKKIAADKGIVFEYSQIPRFILEPYAVEDAVFAEKLWFLFREPIKKFANVYAMEKRLSPVILGMQWHGMMVNRDFVKRQSHVYRGEIKECFRSIQALLRQKGVKIPDFNPRSSRHVGHVLEQTGLPVSRTARGNVITDAKTLLQFQSEPVIRAILLHRFLSKQKTVYFDSLRDVHTTDSDPVAHFFIFQAGTRTGRMSAELIQTVPKAEESRTTHAPKLARMAFIPRPGYEILSIDYKALQMRIFFHFAKARSLIEKVKQGYDPHDAACDLIFGRIDKSLRRITKDIQFGLVFGMGLNKLIRTLNTHQIDGKTVTNFEAGRILQRYHAGVPVKRFMGECMRELAGKGYLKLKFDSPLMNFHREYRIDQEMAYIGSNTLIQGTEAYVMKYAMLRCDRVIRKRGMDVTMLMQIHDELLFEVSVKEPIYHIVKELCRAMEDNVSLDIPLEVDAKISGKSWGEVEDWDKVKDQYRRVRVCV